jgi:type III secretion system low calcium response chaperone LcrH/SycD
MTTAPSNLKLKAFSEESVEEFYSYGFAQYNAGNWDQAKDLFTVLCAQRPLDARFWFGLGATMQESGNYLDALHSWAMGALLRNEDPYPHFHAAECYFSLEDNEQGIKALREVELRMTKEHPLEIKFTLLKEQWSCFDVNS